MFIVIKATLIKNHIGFSLYFIYSLTYRMKLGITKKT